jgi:hypothetical protein
MYVGFELKNYRNLSSIPTSERDLFKSGDKAKIDNLKKYLICQFEKDDVIDAEEVAKHLFPSTSNHIFLSHSHGDEQCAIDFAISMKKKGVDVFVDSCAWGYFQDLIDSLNRQYALPEHVDGRTIYDYNRATEIAAGVHMILASALQRMISNCELFVFLNSSNSTPIKDYKSFDRTLSPWISSELQFSALASHDIPPRRRKSLGLENINEQRVFKSTASDGGVKFAFKAFNKHLPDIDGADLFGWYTDARKEGFSLLDSLYDKFDLESSFFKFKRATKALPERAPAY